MSLLSFTDLPGYVELSATKALLYNLFLTLMSFECKTRFRYKLHYSSPAWEALTLV